MNVLLCCLQSDLVSHHFWRENCKTSLEAMGHRVFEPEGLDFLEPLLHVLDNDWIERQRSLTSEQLCLQLKRLHQIHGIDLFFSYFWSIHVCPGAIREIERLGIPTVNYFCDNMREFESVSELVNHYTLNWVPEKKACDLYTERRAPFIYLPMSADPRFYEPHFGGELPQVTFIGSADYMRSELLGSALASEIPLRIYGRGWIEDAPEIHSGTPIPPNSKLLGRMTVSVRQHWNRLRRHGPGAEWRHFSNRKGVTFANFREIATASIAHDEMVRLTTNSAVVLGINRCPHPAYSDNDPLVYSRLRDVEAPMMGACYLTEYCEDVVELYEIGKEVAVYRTAEEMVSESKRLLKDQDARRSLRALGRKAALSRHTWQHRFEKLFRALRLDTPQPPASFPGRLPRSQESVLQ
jgi:hypothetical protein